MSRGNLITKSKLLKNKVSHIASLIEFPTEIFMVQNIGGNLR